MADYAIGDLQGCYDALLRLLDHLDFNDKLDRLYFVGDLVNRGPQSLEVLRFIKQLPIKPVITLGNHDLHLLARIFNCCDWISPDDTLEQILTAPDAEELGQWLRMQAILHYEASFNTVICHAGIAPNWTLTEAKARALELEHTLHSEQFKDFLRQMYGNQPDHWSDDLQGFARLRVICNYFTRMRFCNAEGHLNFSYKGTVENSPKKLYPWYNLPNRKEIEADIVFGHWAALVGKSPHPRIHAIDTGCLWGGRLTALRLQDKRRFSVPGLAC